MRKRISIAKYKKNIYQDSWRNAAQFLPPEGEKVLVINIEMHDIGRLENGKWFSLCWNRIMKDDAITH